MLDGRKLSLRPACGKTEPGDHPRDHRIGSRSRVEVPDRLISEIKGHLGFRDPVSVEGLDVGVIEMNPVELRVAQKHLKAGVDCIAFAGPQGAQALLWQHPRSRSDVFDCSFAGVVGPLVITGDGEHQSD